MVKNVSVTSHAVPKQYLKERMKRHFLEVGGFKCIQNAVNSFVPSFINDKQVRLFFHDWSSGKLMISEAAKRLAASKEPISMKTLHRAVYDVSSVDAVPLTIIFGIPHVFGGLLPWQSTSTEILTWPSHSSLTESDFGSLLTRFFRITQRWGR
nr:unnamed protein product [Spirometra erinaceieuropaei]